MQSVYRLVMRSGPSVGKVYPLDKTEMFVGRDLNNDIVINDPEISRRHSRFYAQDNGFVLEDLGSTNGTFVNGQRLLGPYLLHPGDSVTFGERLSVVFESSDVDQDATMVSPSARGGYPPRVTEVQVSPYPPDMQPVQEPVNRDAAAIYPPQPSAPIPPAYTGQVPGAYAQDAGQVATAGRRNTRTWLIALIILVLVCLCVSAILFFAPKEFWCLFPIWPTGACP